MIKKNIQKINIMLIIASIVTIICLIIFPVVIDSCASPCPENNNKQTDAEWDPVADACPTYCFVKRGINATMLIPVTVLIAASVNFVLKKRNIKQNK